VHSGADGPPALEGINFRPERTWRAIAFTLKKELAAAIVTETVMAPRHPWEHGPWLGDRQACGKIRLI
jgi:hypothetical protein